MYSKKKWHFSPPGEVLKRKAMYIQPNIVARSHTIYTSSATMTLLCPNTFLSFALERYLNSRNKTNNCTRVRCVYHVIRHQRVSVAVAAMIRVTWKNAGSPNSLSKCISEPVDVTKNISNFPHCHCMSTSLLQKSDKAKFVLKTQKKWMYCFILLMYTLYWKLRTT